MKYYCNPLNLPYKYQFSRLKQQEKPQAILYREAADPSLALFRGKYYLFPSMTAGFYVSDDLLDWQFHEFLSEMPIYGYAPDIAVVGEYLYMSASKLFAPYSFYRTKDPLKYPFERLEGTFPFWDPNMFYDDDGKLYFYWGCSNKDPLYGVELDKETLLPLTDPIPLVDSDITTRGFERPGEDHLGKEDQRPFIEGVWITKHNGCYYLQYATPGTEFNIYADGVFIADKPLGPFKLASNNPYSYKPGGFITGAGHGSTLCDKNGNYWHVSTNSISINHIFERRISLWKAGFTEDGDMYCDQRYGDFPIAVDAPPFAKPEWMLLSYGKKVTATGGSGCENITDENVHTWWQGELGQSVMVDLGKVMEVNAIQINFADDRMVVDMPDKGLNLPYFGRYIETKSGYTQWLLEASVDGHNFGVLTDKSRAKTDLPHDFSVYDQSKNIRFVKLTIINVPYGKPCISGVRIFGLDDRDLPAPARNIRVKRVDDLDIEVSWEGSAVGYTILWGYAPDKLFHSRTVFGKNKERIGALIKGQSTYIRVDAFNESGITEGTVTECATDCSNKESLSE